MRQFPFGLIIIFSLSFLSAQSQDQKSITGDFNNISFSQLTREIEAQTNWHIYYDSSETDSIVINLHADHLSLQQVFDAVFKNTDIHYSVTDDNAVFVSKRFSIQTTLP